MLGSKSNASGNIGGGIGSEPTSGSPPIWRAGGEAFDLIRSSLFLVTLEATNHRKAVEHEAIEEIVEIEGEHEGNQVQAVPLVYMHPLVESTCHHDLRHGEHQQPIALNITNFNHLILMNVGD